MDIGNRTLSMADLQKNTLVSGNKAMQMLELSRHSFEKVVKDGLLTIIYENGKKYYQTGEIEAFMSTDVRIPYKSTERLKSPVKYKAADGTTKIWQPNPKGAMRGDVWNFPTLAGKRFEKEKTSHPTQKPEALIMELIKAFCPKDNEGFYCGTILDPFHGSGTLGVCCEKLNAEGHHIKWLGIELEQQWCEIAQKRLDELKQ